MPYPLSDDQRRYYAQVTPGSPSPSVASGEGIEPSPKNPRNARALLIICYNRPEYLTRTLQSVHDRLPLFNRPHIYVSQDGDVASVTRVIADFAAKFKANHPDVPFNHILHPANDASSSSSAALRGGAPAAPPPAWATGYYKLSQHFRWALNKLFEEVHHPRVIILEDDLEIAVDFFDYFSAMEPLLDTDESLLAVSAWSDLGQTRLISDPRQVHRSDFFPGLGWMLTRHTWEELGPKWPDAFWDDWLREPPQRKGRQFLRPEVSRTYTFGESGVSQAQFFAEYLATIKLNDVPVEWTSEDTSYLDAAQWDEDMQAAIRGAIVVADLQAFASHSCENDGGGPTNSLAGLLAGEGGTRGASVPPTSVVFRYTGTQDYPSVSRVRGLGRSGAVWVAGLARWMVAVLSLGTRFPLHVPHSLLPPRAGLPLHR